MKSLQLISITPEQLQDAIVKGVRAELEIIKKDFQPKKPTTFLTRSEVRDMFNVDLSTVHNWTKKGKLKAYGIGNRIYYRRDEVEAALIPLSN